MLKVMPAYIYNGHAQVAECQEKEHWEQKLSCSKRDTPGTRCSAAASFLQGIRKKGVKEKVMEI